MKRLENNNKLIATIEPYKSLLLRTGEKQSSVKVLPKKVKKQPVPATDGTYIIYKRTKCHLIGHLNKAVRFNEIEAGTSVYYCQGDEKYIVKNGLESLPYYPDIICDYIDLVPLNDQNRKGVMKLYLLKQLKANKKNKQSLEKKALANFGFHDNPVKLRFDLEKILSGPEPNFHYQCQD